jgi:hypothetical protein
MAGQKMTEQNSRYRAHPAGIWLTTRRRVLPEKLAGPHPRISPHFMEPKGSLPVITKTHHMTLPWARTIQSMPPSNFLMIRFNIILHLRLGLQSEPFPSGLLTKALYAPVL